MTSLTKLGSYKLSVPKMSPSQAAINITTHMPLAWMKHGDETPEFIQELIFGPVISPKRDDMLYVDLHAHFPLIDSITQIVNEVSPRVDVVSMVTRVHEINNGYMSFDDVKRKLQEEKMEHTILGPSVAKIESANGPFYIVGATEVMCHENQEVIFLRNPQQYYENEMSLEDTLKSCESVGGFCFLDHPFSIATPTVMFRYPTQEELTLRRRWFDSYRPIIEVHNQQNTLWMQPSNGLAKSLAREHGLPEIATSDAHLDKKEAGQSRSYFPRILFDDSSEDAFFSSLNKAFMYGAAVQHDRHYSSLAIFAKNMILPVFTDPSRRK